MWQVQIRSYPQFRRLIQRGADVVLYRRQDFGMQASLLVSLLEDAKQVWIEAADGSWRAQVWLENGSNVHSRPIKGNHTRSLAAY